MSAEVYIPNGIFVVYCSFSLDEPWVILMKLHSALCHPGGGGICILLLVGQESPFFSMQVVILTMLLLLEDEITE